eukprot:1400895-Rhodomonas_salina.1
MTVLDENLKFAATLFTLGTSAITFSKGFSKLKFNLKAVAEKQEKQSADLKAVAEKQFEDLKVIESVLWDSG